MKKFVLFFSPIIILVGCFNTIEENNLEDIDFMDDPQYKYLIPYKPITDIMYNNNDYSDYDSLFCYYGIIVTIIESNWNKKHDSLHIKRLKVDNDTNWWDYASLYGKRRDETEWEEICNKRLLPDTLDSCYYKMLEILDVINHEIESRIYYFDSIDWKSNQDYYERLFNRKNVQFSIRGKVLIVT